MGFSSLFAPNIDKLVAKQDVQGLVKALAHGNEGVRRRAAFALAHLSFEEQAQIMGARALGEFDDAEATNCLLQMLNCMGAQVREAAALVLAQKKGTPAVVAVIEALREKDQNVRYDAAQGLGKIGDQRAVKPLIELLEGPAVKMPVRLAALRSLAEIGDARALPEIMRFVNATLPGCFPDRGADVFFVKDVAKHLGRMGKEAIPALVELLPFGSGFYSPKEEVLAACRQVGPDSIGPLVTALHSRSERERSDAADILNTLGWKPGTSDMVP